MKAMLKAEYREVPNHEELPILKYIKAVADEHGYKGLFPIICFIVTVLKDKICHKLAWKAPISSMRVALHRLRGVKIGEKVHFGPDVWIDEVYPYYVKIGNGVSIDGDNMILVHNKPMSYHAKVGKSYISPVVIKDNAEISIRAIILPGVTIGEGSIIAAGSVVTKSIPPFVMAAGTPAVVKRDLAELVRHNYSESKFKKIMQERLTQYGF
ncbi:MAG: acyltransferase [Candidatus Cloacimonetes bacterium]|nr:acyltransferase [Candidatus Cloacimonadota bacterium]